AAHPPREGQARGRVQPSRPRPVRRRLAAAAHRGPGRATAYGRRGIPSGRGGGRLVTFPQLLAKSQKKGEPFHTSMLLRQHLEDVYSSAARVLDATQDEQLNALGLMPEQYRDRLRRVVLLAAAVHDLGKANDHFQGMLHGRRDVRTNPQGLRHEWATLLI